MPTDWFYVINPPDRSDWVRRMFTLPDRSQYPLRDFLYPKEQGHMADDTQTFSRTEIDAAADLTREFLTPSFGTLPVNVVGGMNYAVIPAGQSLHSLKPLEDERAERPARRTGKLKLTDVPSFIAVVQRYMTAGISAIFVDDTMRATNMTAVLNYNPPGGFNEAKAEFGDHRAHIDMRYSKQYKAWTGFIGEQFRSANVVFDFLEKNAGDILAPELALNNTAVANQMALLGGRLSTAPELLLLMKSFKLNAERRFVEVRNPRSGEIQFTFEEEHRATDGGALDIPSAFAIGIPVFHAGAAEKKPTIDVILITLRYRMVDKRPHWRLLPYKLDNVEELAFNNVVARVAKETTLPIYRGSPEEGFDCSPAPMKPIVGPAASKPGSRV